MGRPRKSNKHLPRSMFLSHGAYYYVHGGKWHPLGKDYGAALRKYADFVGVVQTIRTVHDMLWSCIEENRARLAAATIEGYERSAANIEAVFGKMLPEDVTPQMVKRYVKQAGTVQANRDKAFFSVAYTYLRTETDYTGPDPTKRLQYRNKETPRDRYVTDTELNAILAKASAKLACIARFLELTGMRQGDALRLKMIDLDDQGFTYWNTKSKKRQGLEWSDELTATVEDAKKLWRRFGREWLFESKPKGKHAKRGIGPYTPSGLRSLWDTARRKAGLADIRLHDLRAKAGSDMATDEDAAAMLGHSDVKVTRRHYRRKVKRVKPTR